VDRRDKLGHDAKHLWPPRHSPRKIWEKVTIRNQFPLRLQAVYRNIVLGDEGWDGVAPLHAS